MTSETLPHLKITREQNVTVRNDPDGRSRLNVNIFDGNIIVTDFGDVPLLGNIQTNTLQEAYEKWSASKTAKSLSCHCPAVKCLGPNVLVKTATIRQKISYQKQQTLHYKKRQLIS